MIRGPGFKIKTKQLKQTSIYFILQHGSELTCICSAGTSKVNDSLKYGFSVHFLMDVFFFLSRLPLTIKYILTYGSICVGINIIFIFCFVNS